MLRLVTIIGQSSPAQLSKPQQQAAAAAAGSAAASAATSAAAAAAPDSGPVSILFGRVRRQLAALLAGLLPWIAHSETLVALGSSHPEAGAIGERHQPLPPFSLPLSPPPPSCLRCCLTVCLTAAAADCPLSSPSPSPSPSLGKLQHPRCRCFRTHMSGCCALRLRLECSTWPAPSRTCAAAAWGWGSWRTSRVRCARQGRFVYALPVLLLLPLACPVVQIPLPQNWN